MNPDPSRCGAVGRRLAELHVQRSWLDCLSLPGVPSQPLETAAAVGSIFLPANVLERVGPDGSVKFAWNMFDSLSVANIAPSIPVARSALDFTHTNSIDVMADGNHLISSRNMSQVYKLDASTGALVWTLRGVHGDFTFVNDPLGGFSLQHAARELPSGDILLFDDGDNHTPPQSRAVEYRPDLTARTATLVWSTQGSQSLYAEAMGNAQRLPDGHTLIAYGTAGHVQEVDEAGNVVWDLANTTPHTAFYRAFRVDSLY